MKSNNWNVGDRVRVLECGIHFEDAGRVGTVVAVKDGEFEGGDKYQYVGVKLDDEDREPTTYDRRELYTNDDGEEVVVIPVGPSVNWDAEFGCYIHECYDDELEEV